MLRRLVSLNVVNKVIRCNKPLSTSSLTSQRYDGFEDDDFGGRSRGGGGGGGGSRGGWGQRDFGGDRGGDRGGYGGRDRGGYDDGYERQGGYGGGRPVRGGRGDFDDGFDRRGGYGGGSYGGQGGRMGGGSGPPPQDPEKQKRSIFLASLPWSATEDEMAEFCSQAGKVEEFRIIYDRQTGRSKGFGFCMFSDEETAKNAVEKLNNVEFQGRNLVVKPPRGLS